MLHSLMSRILADFSFHCPRERGDLEPGGPGVKLLAQFHSRVNARIEN